MLKNKLDSTSNNNNNNNFSVTIAKAPLLLPYQYHPSYLKILSFLLGSKQPGSAMLVSLTPPWPS